VLLAISTETRSCNLETNCNFVLAFRYRDESYCSKRKNSFVNCLGYMAQIEHLLKRHLENYQYFDSGTNNYLCHKFTKNLL
jgi:hypothetical protein